MKKFLLPVLASALVFSACSSAPADEDIFEYEAPEREATVAPMMTGSPLEVDCASEDWTCFSEYGGATIETQPDPFVGMIQVLEMFRGFDTLDIQIDSYKGQPGWEDAEVLERYAFSGGEVGVISASNGKTKWMLVKDVDGKTDHRMKCEATVESDAYEALKSGIEAICESMRSS